MDDANLRASSGTELHGMMGAVKFQLTRLRSRKIYSYKLVSYGHKAENHRITDFRWHFSKILEATVMATRLNEELTGKRRRDISARAELQLRVVSRTIGSSLQPSKLRFSELLAHQIRGLCDSNRSGSGQTSRSEEPMPSWRFL